MELDESMKPEIGQVVQIRRGRDHGRYAIIIGIVNHRFALIADGEKRKFDQPKKKNLLHLQLQDEISSEVVNSLLESGRVTNGKLRFAINRFVENRQTDDAQEKGE
jgi:large subunit ribosomal protein L14e